MSGYLKKVSLRVMEEQDIDQHEIQRRVDIISKGFQNSGIWFGSPMIPEFGQGEELIAGLIEWDIYQLSLMYFSSSALHITADKKINDDRDVLTRKMNRLIYVDEYGDEVRDVWDKALAKYYKEKLEVNIIKNVESQLRSHLEEFNISYLDWACYVGEINENIRKLSISNIAFNLYMFPSSTSDAEKNGNVDFGDGEGYEIFLVNKINESTDWTAEITSLSGDQGADLILQKSGITAVVQIKNHSNKVGNEAVQEAYAAKKHYGADLAFVVSRVGFTNSAMQLSESTGVNIMTEKDFMDFLS